MNNDAFKALDHADLQRVTTGRRYVEPDEHGNRAQRRLWKRRYGQKAPPRTKRAQGDEPQP